MSFAKVLGTALVATLTLPLVACGGGDAGQKKPSMAEAFERGEAEQNQLKTQEEAKLKELYEKRKQKEAAEQAEIDKVLILVDAKQVPTDEVKMCKASAEAYDDYVRSLTDDGVMLKWFEEHKKNLAARRQLCLKTADHTISRCWAHALRNAPDFLKKQGLEGADRLWGACIDKYGEQANAAAEQPAKK